MVCCFYLYSVVKLFVILIIQNLTDDVYLDAFCLCVWKIVLYFKAFQRMKPSQLTKTTYLDFQPS